MTDRRCPVPACTEPVPPGDTAIFCLEHYWLLPAKESGFLFRWKSAALRCEDVSERAYRFEQLDGYVAAAVRKLTDPSPTSSPATAMPPTSSRAATAGAGRLSLPAGTLLRFSRPAR